MAIQLRVITDEDWNVLKRLVEQNRNLLQSPITRPTANSQYLDGDDSMSPEVYIALPPAEGIPGLDSTATGTGTDNPPAEGDRPGHAECNIYRIVDGELKLVSGITRTVYNLSESEIAQDWILIQRDKFGKWLPVQGGSGGSGAEIISFEIVDVVRGIGFRCNAMTCTVIGIHCASASVSVGDSITVWDGLECFWNAPFEVLEGVKGYAIKMTTPSTLFNDGGEERETPCSWEVLKMCCVEEPLV